MIRLAPTRRRVTITEAMVWEMGDSFNAWTLLPPEMRRRAKRSNVTIDAHLETQIGRRDIAGRVTFTMPQTLTKAASRTPFQRQASRWHP